MASTDARPVPKKNTAFRFHFALRKTDLSIITGWTGADSEVSLDGGAFADCTAEATEIGASGCGYIDLTAGEMNADTVVLKITFTNTGAVALVFVFNPEESGDIRADATLNATQANYAPAKAGDAMTLTAAYDAAKTAAPASTALSNVTWTDAKAAKVDNLDAAITTRAAAATALSNVTWTDAKAGFLVGQVATQADVQGITQAQRVRVLPPMMMERPDSSTLAYRIWIYAYDEQHKAEDLDSYPVVTAENNTGVDRSANLGSVTKPGATTGQYYVDYTVASGHAIEGLVFKANCTEGGVTTQYAAPSIVVDTTAVDFTAADRVKLDALHDTRLTAGRAALLDNIDAVVSTRAAASTALSNATWTAGRAAALDFLDAAISGRASAADLAAAKAILDKFDSMVELDVAVYRFTVNALENAPGGAGGDGVWTTEQRDQVLVDTAATWNKVNGWAAPLVVYNGGVAADGSILYLRQGDAYATAMGNALAWTSTTWIDLTGCTAQLIVVDQLTGNTLITEDAVITGAGTGTQTITVELTPTQTRTLTVGKGTCRFAVVVTKGTDTLAVVVGVIHTTKE